MPLPDPNPGLDGDVMREQLEFLVLEKEAHKPDCNCRACWTYDRAREILLSAFRDDYYDVKHFLKRKATKKAEKAGG